MSFNSKIALFDRNSAGFSFCEIGDHKLMPGELLVKVSMCTVCASDLHTFYGRRECDFPTVLGHEIIGVVERWCGDPPLDYFGNRVFVGQRITWGLCVACNACSNCKRGLTQKCTSLFKYGHTKFDGIRSCGGLAEYCVLVPDTVVFPIPKEVSDKVASPANCATATVMAAIRMAEDLQPLEAKSILITGCGMLGLTACAVCASKGCVNIVANDVDVDRCRLARSFGATASCSPAQLDSVIPENGFDIAFDFSGAPQAIETCLSKLAVGGIAVLAGSVFPSDSVNLNPEMLVRGILTVRGIHNYCAEDLAAALEFLKLNKDKFPFESLVSETFSLEDTDSAFASAEAGKAVRVAVVP